MKMGNKLFCLAVISAVSISCLYHTTAFASSPKKITSNKRADFIKINSMAVFGKLEKSPVQFLHDKHTSALVQKNMDCKSCHLIKDDRIYPKFKRFEDTNRKEVMNLYHEECISCHGEMTIAKEKTGPMDCDGCHTQKNQYVSSRQPMGFDKSLHFSHSQSSENKCEQCHHEYNETKKELFYEKGKEGTCRYCHEKETYDNRISMRRASHLACINCHIQTTVKVPIKEQVKDQAKKQITPPITCTRCHSSIEQQKIKKQIDIPRIKRNQPDIVLLKATPKTLKPDEKRNWMDFVPFNHKTHENSNQTCRTCHHESLQPCNECHTLDGLPDKTVNPSIDKKTISLKNAINLEKAMHKIDSTRSCQGCHNERKQEKNCAGCHSFDGQTAKTNEESCIKCHSIPVQNTLNSSNPNEEILLARTALKSKSQTTNIYNEKDIPKTVTIQNLSKEYKAVTFPHRQIIDALTNGIKNNSLSNSFHNGTETICKGCHHNSPASIKPPQCGNCHSKQWDINTPLKPGIMGAYHQQCMGCHKQMNIKKPMECTECHEKIKN